FNMMDPSAPYTVGQYSTYDGPLQAGIAAAGQYAASMRSGSGGVLNGAWGIDVRNVDGTIVISDIATGFWSFKLDGFADWNGHTWGVPNVPSVQDWDNGPEGAPKATKTS